MTTIVTMPVVTVGQAVTMQCGSDAYPGFISFVSRNGKSITVQRAEHFTAPNSKGEPETIIFPDPDGATRMYSLRANGRFVPVGGKIGDYWSYLGLKGAHYYQDPSF